GARDVRRGGRSRLSGRLGAAAREGCEGREKGAGHGSSLVPFADSMPAVVYLLLIVVYALAQIALGVWIARRVRGVGDFFVAGRALGPGLLAATLLAANIGAGSTVGAAGGGPRGCVDSVVWGAL